MTASSAMKVLVNADDLLSVLAERGARTPAELAQIIGMPRPSVYRLVEALELIGLVALAGDGTVELGIRNARLAEASLAAIPQVAVARPHLHKLAAETGETVYFCVRRGERIVCLDWVQGRRVALMNLTPGNSLPLHAGATSRVITAHEPAVLRHLVDPFEKYTPHTLSTREALAVDAALVLERGYSISDQDVTLGVAALGAAVIDAHGRLQGAVSIAGLRDQILAEVPDLAGRLRDVAERIAKDLQS